MILQPAAPELVLRDIHQSPAPGWWPPAPGWWLLAAALLLLLLLLAAWGWRRQRRRNAIRRLFDDTVAAAPTPAAQVAAMSVLLRRAARLQDPSAATLQGAAWLQYLEQGAAPGLFEGATGELLVEGGYRPAVDADAVARLRPRARQRFLEWMGVP
jgi:hypothetical protein